MNYRRFRSNETETPHHRSSSRDSLASPLRHLLLVLATAMLFAPSAWGASLVETAGLWYVASPTFFGGANSGTYYYPSVIERNGYAFMFTQGGQFSASTSPVTWCGGDHITLWRAPLTNSGLRSPFVPLRRVSPCHSDATYTVHWVVNSNYFSTAQNKVHLVVGRQEILKATGQQVSYEVWLLKGSFNASQTDIVNWTYHRLFVVTSGAPDVSVFTLAPDTTRTPPSDGYAHELFRGFARAPFAQTVETRFDYSQKYCDNGQSSGLQECVLIEFKKNGVWLSVLPGDLNFTPDVLIASFRPDNLVTRNGVLELWGSALVAGNDCPCAGSTQAAQFRWYTVSPSTFALTGPNGVWSQIRCMPAEPHNYRIGAEIVVLADGTQYLLSSQNDDAGCGLANPFIGMDVVSAVVQ